MMNKYRRLRRGALALALLGAMSGTAQADVLYAYEDISLGQGWPHSLTFGITGPNDVSIDIQTMYFPDVIPIHKLFETDGVGGTLTLTETITNTGTTAWNSWSEALWEEYPGMNAPGNPGANVSWGASGASAAGLFSVDAVAGTIDFSFASPLLGGQSFTLTKSINYADGVFVIGVAEAPAAVPVPAALPLLLSGLAGLGLAGRGKLSRKGA